jgi:amidase
VLTNYMTGDIDADIRDTVRAVTRAMAAAGAEVVDVRVADFDSITANTSVINFETDDDLQAYLRGIPGAPALTARGILERGLFHDAMAGRILMMDTTGNGDPAQYARNLARQQVLRGRLIALMDSLRVDAIAYPTSRRRPVFVGDPQPGSTCQLSAVTGLPALSAPAGFTNDGLPVGIEFLGRPRADVRLVGLAFALEQLGARRLAPSTTPALRQGRAPAPVVVTHTVQSNGARATTRFTWDATANQLRYDVRVTGVTSRDLQAVVVRRAGDGRTGSPVIHRMAGPGMLAATGAFPLSGQDRAALERGTLSVALFTTRGMQESAVRFR